MSQAVFARLLDVSTGTLSKWERGQLKPRGPARRLLHIIKRKGIDTAERIVPPVIPDGAMRAKGEQRSDPGPREAGCGSFREVPDSLAFGSTSGMTGESFGSLI